MWWGKVLQVKWFSVCQEEEEEEKEEVEEEADQENKIVFAET